MRFGWRAWLAVGVAALPCLLALVACSTEGATPNCSAPDAGCEPAGPDLNPDAHFVGPGADAGDAGNKNDGPITVDTGLDGRSEAGDAPTDAPSDAKLDGDAKG